MQTARESAQKTPPRTHSPARRDHLCGVFLPDEDERTLDHVTVLSRGGTHDPSKAALACQRCNSFKGRMSLDEFKLLLAWMLERLPAAG